MKQTMKWLFVEEQGNSVVYRCSVCNSEISVKQGEELPYCKHCESEPDGEQFTTDIRMTDNEIIKALECLEADTNCYDCALYNKKEYKGKCVFTNTLDLIKRKDEQIESLIAGQETLQKALNEKIEEVEKITEVYGNLIIEKDELFDEAERLIKQAKSESVKEFAERLKYNFKGDSVCDFLFVRITIETVEKEMVGDEE